MLHLLLQLGWTKLHRARRARHGGTNPDAIHQPRTIVCWCNKHADGPAVIGANATADITTIFGTNRPAIATSHTASNATPNNEHADQESDAATYTKTDAATHTKSDSATDTAANATTHTETNPKSNTSPDAAADACTHDVSPHWPTDEKAKWR